MADLSAILRELQVASVVPFETQKDRIIGMDFSETNVAIPKNALDHLPEFESWVNQQIANRGYRYGIGGYLENRNVYSTSSLFNPNTVVEEPRSLHLGVDIWGKVNTPVFACLDGWIHSFAYNSANGDYGATIILAHQVGEHKFHSLYGHLSRRDIEILEIGTTIKAGTQIAHFGLPEENGGWPPHLHFQLIINMEGWQGDYPGVCKISEKEKYVANCPDPEMVLRMGQFLIAGYSANTKSHQ